EPARLCAGRCVGHGRLYTNFRAELFLWIETTFRDRDREAAFAAIVRAFHQAGSDQIANRGLDSDFVGKIEIWRRANIFSVANFDKSRNSRLVADVTDENDIFARAFETWIGEWLFLINRTDHTAGRRPVD